MSGLTPRPEVGQSWAEMLHEAMTGVPHQVYLLMDTPWRVAAARGDLADEVPMDASANLSPDVRRIRTPRAIHGQASPVSGVIVGMGVPPDRSAVLMPMMRLASEVFRLLWDAAYRAGMSRALVHEVRNPLALMSGYGELLGHRGEMKVAEVIVREVQRINAILEDFMASGRPLDRVDTDLAVMVQHCLAQHQEWFERSQVGLTGSFAAAPIFADLNHLEYVLNNLVRNAVESMPLGGALTVRVAPHGMGGELVLTDTGPGVAPEVRDHLFQPYFTTKPGGHGLGLALAWDVAARHGGTLELLPQHRGAAFRLWMPRRPRGV